MHTCTCTCSEVMRLILRLTLCPVRNGFPDGEAEQILIPASSCDARVASRVSVQAALPVAAVLPDLQVGRRPVLDAVVAAALQ